MKKLLNHLIPILASVMLLNSPVHAAKTVTYYLHDALGSPVALTDENGNLKCNEDYTPYGERIRKEAGCEDNNIWYTGKPEEPDLGLQYFGARWYDPSIGRFTGIDPVKFQEGNIHSFNAYAYANNNPYTYVDPDGRESIVAARARINSGQVLAGPQGSIHSTMPQLATPVPDFSPPRGGQTGIDVVSAMGGAGAVKAFFQAIFKSSVKQGARNSDELFRVVDDIELSDINNTGVFRTAPGSFEGKQFVDNLDDAVKLQAKFSEWLGSNQTVVKGLAPKSVTKNAHKGSFSDIPNGKAITVPKADLHKIKPVLE